MEYLHREFDLAEGDSVEVTLAGNAANVLLLDADNFQKYQQGKPYSYEGGYARGLSQKGSRRRKGADNCRRRSAELSARTTHCWSRTYGSAETSAHCAKLSAPLPLL